MTPKQVTFKTPDGFTVHRQLFEKAGSPSKKPAIVYIHGGPPRQMLLGWHYSDYYANAYAMNQYLANLEFVVLSVNYRLGIGYGFEFHNPKNGGGFGASEYTDIKAAGEWLAKQSQVDPKRIGVYGGSYGGFLTAMALGKDSQLFAARDIQPDEIPEQKIPGGSVRIIAGAFDRNDGQATPGPIQGVATAPLFLEFRLEASARVRQRLTAGHAAFLYPYAGSLSIVADETPHPLAAQ